MATESTSPTPPEPRRFSIRLPRPLWIGVAAVIAILAAVALQTGLPIWRRHTAIRTIEQAGGRVETIVQGGPELLRRFAGNEGMRAFDETFLVHLENTRTTDDALARLRDLKKTQVVLLTGSKVTNIGLGHLEDLTSLDALSMENSDVTDAGLVHLLQLRDLRFLNLANTQITDAGLVQLRELTSLHMVRLDGTRVSDAGIAELQRALPGLKVER